MWKVEGGEQKFQLLKKEMLAGLLEGKQRMRTARDPPLEPRVTGINIEVFSQSSSTATATTSPAISRSATRETRKDRQLSSDRLGASALGSLFDNSSVASARMADLQSEHSRTDGPVKNRFLI